MDRLAERKCREVLGAMDPAELSRRCGAMGGRSLASNADLCCEIPFLPRMPVTLKLWYADEEMPASGRLLLDRCADHYLTIEDAVMLGEMILEALTGGA